MLENVSLKFTEKTEPLVIPAQGVTVFVGPNNSGKSLVLRELEAALSSNSKIETKLLDDFEIIWPTEEKLEQDITSLTRKSPMGTPMDSIMWADLTLAGN